MGLVLANGKYDLALGALILTLTNILAIQFTNALVLWVAGFRRLDTDAAEDEKVKEIKDLFKTYSTSLDREVDRNEK